MSYFRVTCPWCGTEYHTGVVGTTVIGGHACTSEKPCEEPGCTDASAVTILLPDKQFGFRCWEHTDGHTLLMTRPSR